MSQAESQVQKPRSEFLGLHDPYAAPAKGEEAERPAPGPLVTREKAGELLRAGATLAVIMLVMAAAAMAFH